MKIVIYNGGLGNQIFAYLFTLFLKRTFHDENVYAALWSGSLSTHNGLEIQKAFDITLPGSGIIPDTLSKAYRMLWKLGIISRGDENEIRKDKLCFDHYYLEKIYYQDINLHEALPFRMEAIDDKNKDIANKAINTESVSVHIRRGDYMNPDNYERFGKYCDKDYYKRAIKYIQSLYPDAILFFFSDDIEYVKCEYNFENAIYIDCNKGMDSWKDMFLMSRCKHHIIANSTFSYWGAMLSKDNGNSLTIAPKKWFIWDDPNIFPNQWKRI